MYLSCFKLEEANGEERVRRSDEGGNLRRNEGACMQVAASTAGLQLTHEPTHIVEELRPSKG